MNFTLKINQCWQRSSAQKQLTVECVVVIDNSTYTAFASSNNPISNSVSSYASNTNKYIQMLFAYTMNKAYNLKWLILIKKYFKLYKIPSRLIKDIKTL